MDKGIKHLFLFYIKLIFISWFTCCLCPLSLLLWTMWTQNLQSVLHEGSYDMLSNLQLVLHEGSYYLQSNLEYSISFAWVALWYAVLWKCMRCMAYGGGQFLFHLNPKNVNGNVKQTNKQMQNPPQKNQVHDEQHKDNRKTYIWTDHPYLLKIAPSDGAWGTSSFPW